MSKESEIKKLEQGRAEYAYRCVEQVTYELNEKGKREYRSYVKKIPTMILLNGLGQTLAFVKAKAKDGNAYKLLYNQITEYMKSNSTIRIQMPPDKNELIEWVISCDSREYRWITQELLAFLNWLKRFAEGMIEEEEE